MNFFTRKRVKHNQTAGILTYAQGDILLPGVASLAYESLLANPLYYARVFPEQQFIPPSPVGPALLYQNISLPSTPAIQGQQFNELAQQGLISQDDQSAYVN